ncbi:MAG: FAD-dependent oxidoreductase [Sphingomonas bacterium]|uniref:FAD/NAD(P)-binding protein n=1 Tax=Sphingomonas bacterium TaxID=1895847 RepID=UPI00261A6A48|nr:FAD/NAD(P)-binding protein [Sphingomonas bacterium]MDB5696340.1 FAD-dependent oxidoreductase [Sphingomonas bacterium]
MRPDQHLLIIGGGFSGTLLAINLLRHDGPRATLLERRRAQFGRGVAYSAAHPRQLLNVRAAGMSAFPDEPDHFARWVMAKGAGRQDFVPRAFYGEYLRDTLAVERRGREGRLALVAGEAIDLDTGETMAAQLADGATLAADGIVLATGNLTPHAPAGIDADAMPPGCYVADPWRADLAAGLGQDDTVVLLGTGLTAIDAALQLDASGFLGQVLALSRRGLTPRRHRDGLPPLDGLHEVPDRPLSRLVADVRAVAEQIGWRAAVDAYRPVTQRLWAASDATVRRRFMRHLRPFWDVHRHRLAPAVADRIDALVAGGRLRFAAGKVQGCQAEQGGLTLRWRPRHGGAVTVTRAARVVNCTGPQGDLTRTDEPLLRKLLERGMIRPDPLRLGLDVDARSQVVARDGSVDGRLQCIGPMTRGALWEVVAVPDLRRQTWNLARRLANAQWVGGEGL